MTAPSNPSNAEARADATPDGHLITAAAAARIAAEIAALRLRLDEEIPARLREARGGGADEQLAIREEEALIDSRIAALEDLLGRCRVVGASDPSADRVALGSAVEVCDRESGARSRYLLVGMHDALGPGEVSAGSPVGQALIGRRAGETVEVELPGGRRRRLAILSTSASGEPAPDPLGGDAA